MLTRDDYRRGITKSKSGHYHLTLVHKATKIKVFGSFGHSSSQQAIASEEPALVKKLIELTEALAAKSL